MNYVEDTIAAISTPLGSGGIGIIRVSGEESFEIVSKIFRGSRPFCKIKSHTINYGKVVDPENKEVIDEVLSCKKAYCL